MLVQWQREFEIGHPRTDAEHRDVVDLLNELDASLGADASPAAVDRALDTLAHLLSTHLNARADAEEAFERLRDLRRAWDQGAPELGRNDLRALAHWWLRHLCSHSR